MNAPSTFEEFAARLQEIDRAPAGTVGKGIAGSCPDCTGKTSVSGTDWEKSNLVVAFVNQGICGYMTKDQVLAALKRADEASKLLGPLSYPGRELAGQVSSLLSRLARTFCSLEEIAAIIRDFKHIGVTSRMGMSVKLDLGDIVSAAERASVPPAA